MRAFKVSSSGVAKQTQLRSECLPRSANKSHPSSRRKNILPRTVVHAQSHKVETHDDGSVTFRFEDDSGSVLPGADEAPAAKDQNDRISNSQDPSSSTSTSERQQIFHQRTGLRATRKIGRQVPVQVAEEQRSARYEHVGSRRMETTPATMSSGSSTGSTRLTAARAGTILAGEQDLESVLADTEQEESLLDGLEIDHRVLERLERIAQDEPKRRLEDIASMDVNVSTAEALYLLRAFSDLARLGQLDKAISLVEQIVAAERQDVLIRLRHKHFFRAAGERRAVKEAFRFVQVLPRKYVDARTYNMLVSVCVAAGDVKSAFAAADMFSSTGRKLDSILYTNLITACATAGNVTRAFKVFSEMKREGMKLDKYIFSALITCCTKAIVRTDDRRRQLVHMERAFAVFEEMVTHGIRADAAVWNAIITAAGKAGMVDRASQALSRMQTMGCKPNERTYTAVVHAFGNAGQKDEALKAYRKALREGLVHSLPLYAAAIGACANAQQGDLESALEVYRDLQRHCVKPDGLLYGQLIVVAGKAGNLQMAFQLQREMEDRRLPRSQETFSALILACVANNSSDARRVYQEMRLHRIQPTMKAFNALINAYGKAFRLGDVVTLVSDMKKMGLKPDAYTYAAIMNACQRADAAELAFEVVRVMKESGIQLNECHCFILLRICYNRLRAGWCVGGYPPRPRHHDVLPVDRSHEGRVLIESLAGYAPLHLEAQQDFDTSQTKWVNRAIAVYRDTVAAGVQPGMRVLERLLACLRKERKEEEAADMAEVMMGFKAEQVILQPSVIARMHKESWCHLEDIYDHRAVTLLEAAIFSGQIPQFKLDGKGQVDLRGLLPSVAEVYILSMLSALQRKALGKSKTIPGLKLLVPPYHPRNIFFPSYGVRDEADGEAEDTAVQQEAVAGGTQEGGHLGTSSTSLAVAGLLRNMGIKCQQSPDEGLINVHPQEVTRWVFRSMQHHDISRNVTVEDASLSGFSTANHKLRRGLQSNLGPWTAPGKNARK